MAYEPTQSKPGTTRTKSTNPHKGTGGNDGTVVPGLASPPGARQSTTTHYPHEKSAPVGRPGRSNYEGQTQRGVTRNERVSEPPITDATVAADGTSRVSQIPAP